MKLRLLQNGNRSAALPETGEQHCIPKRRIVGLANSETPTYDLVAGIVAGDARLRQRYGLGLEQAQRPDLGMDSE